MEFLGTLKVKIVRGISLAVRDLLSSDPYVVATLGAQVYNNNVVSHRLHFFVFGIYNFITYFYIVLMLEDFSKHFLDDVST